ARGGSSCGAFRPALHWLAVRRSSSFSRGIVASLGIQSWLCWGSRLFKLCARVGSRCRPSMQRRNRLTFRSRRTAAPPLNSSVRRLLVLVLRVVCFAQLHGNL